MAGIIDKIPNLNSQIRDILVENNINLEDGISYLICINYGLKPSFVPVDLERKILAVGILNKDLSSNTICWKVPLFGEQTTNFEWISEWMDLFKKVNPGRRGVKTDVLRRMKKFFANFPDIRKDEVFYATYKYIQSVNDPQYIKKSHKFIFEQDGSSMLKDYVDEIRRLEDGNESELI